MIQISNLSKKYGETVVFSDLNYTFENACIYGLVGRNGAGKTTLLNILSNYEKIMQVSYWNVLVVTPDALLLDSV